MNAFRYPREKAPAGAPAFFLLLAFSLGGLRSGPPWLFFSALFLPWLVFSRRGFSFSGSEAALMFFAWLGAAALFSTGPAASVYAVSKYAVFGLLYLSAASASEGEEAWVNAVLGLGAASAVVFLAQRLTGRPAVGLIGSNPNYSAVFCAAAFPAALLSALAAGTGKRKLLYAGFAVLAAAGAALSGSRGAAAAALLSSAAGLAASGRRRGLLALSVAALAAAALLPAHALETLLKLSDPRAFARPSLWAAALKAAASRPFFGFGPGLFAGAFELFKFPFFDGISYYGHYTPHAHSEVFNLAAEAGFPAMVFFLWTAASGLFKKGPAGLPVRLCALAVFIQGGGDMIFYSGAVSLLFWGSLGFSARGEGEARGAGKEQKAALALLCAAGLLLGPAAGAWNGKDGFLRFSAASAGRNTALALAAARLGALEKPADPFSADREGRAAAAAGELDLAESAFRKALALEPFFAGAALDLSGLFAAEGRYAEACGGLARLEALPAAAPASDYQRELLAFDRAAAEKLKKDLCGKTKKRTGTATAPRRPAR